jgi:ketosteroid isomerase-like protein
MSAEGNLATIRAIYDAFGTGDVETILDAVADDLDWAVDAEPVAPWYGQRTGKDSVASFFADIAGSTEMQDFAVEGMGASDNEVFAFLRFAARMTATGREASFHLHH